MNETNSSALVLYLNRVNAELAKYGSPLFAVIGFISNLFACICLPLHHKHVNRHTMYLTVLAFVELMFNIIWFWLLLIPMHSFKLNHYFNQNKIFCKIYGALMQFCLGLAFNIILAMSVDRCVAFQEPIRSRNWKAKSALFISLAVCCADLILSLPFSFVYTITNNWSTGNICIPYYENKISKHLFTWFQILINPNGMVIIIAMFIANITLVINLASHYRNRELLLCDIKINPSQKLKAKRKEFRSSMQIIALSLVFLILTSSINISYIIWMFTDSEITFELVQIFSSLFLFQQNCLFIGYFFRTVKKLISKTFRY
uniref:GCR100 n=1 Tax=Schmidtea mediterranea TaxID=79327 RepID=A0A193KUK4_SCHMD|nr:GCR100 [Schmidtea mediterranea]